MISMYRHAPCWHVLVTLNDIPLSTCPLLAGVFVTLNDIHLTTCTLLAGVSRKSFWTAYGVIWQTKVLPRLMSTPVNHWRESFTLHYIKHFVCGSITVCLLVLLTIQHMCACYVTYSAYLSLTMKAT